MGLFTDIRKYIYVPAAIFDLNGRCYTNEPGVPCRIRVGPRRFLEISVHPQQLSVTIWHRTKDRLTYLLDLPVETSVDKDGVLTVDLVAFARKQFGKDNVTFCNSDSWRWRKNRSWSDTFLATEQGLATSRSTWQDINVTNSSLLFVPGALTLCGHSVRSISWESFNPDLGAESWEMRPLTETLLRAPHTLIGEDFLKTLETVKTLQNSSFNHITIATDRGVYGIGSGVYSKVTVALANGWEQETYSPTPGLSALQDIQILLQLMQAEGLEAVEAKLEDLCQQELLSWNNKH